MKVAQRIALLLTLLFLFFDGKLPVNVHLHFHVSAKPGGKSVEKSPTPSAITKASGSYYVSGQRALLNPLPDSARFPVIKSPCHLLKTAQLNGNGGSNEKQKCETEVLQKKKVNKKMVVMKVFKGGFLKKMKSV